MSNEDDPDPRSTVETQKREIETLRLQLASKDKKIQILERRIKELTLETQNESVA